MTKKIKVFYGNQHVKHIRVNTNKISVKTECKRILATVSKLIALQSLTAIALASTIIAFTDPVTSVQAQVITQQAPISIASIPVLQRIADCESGSRNKQGKPILNTATQFASNGQVLTNPNVNHSVDIGIMQINLLKWGSKATTLGYDLSTTQGNESMGLWIYENRGTEDWYSSKSCWQ